MVKSTGTSSSASFLTIYQLTTSTWVTIPVTTAVMAYVEQCDGDIALARHEPGAHVGHFRLSSAINGSPLHNLCELEAFLHCKCWHVSLQDIPHLMGGVNRRVEVVGRLSEVKKMSTVVCVYNRTWL